MLVRRKFTDVPWMKLRLLRYRTFFSSRLQDFTGRPVETIDLLLRQPEALDELDVAKRLGRRSGQRRRFPYDDLLDLFDPAAQNGTEHSQNRHRQEVRWRNQPVHAEGIDHHEDDADERGEQDVDGGRDELLDVGSYFLQLAERLAAALILEHRIGELERVANPVRIQLRAEPLRNHVDVVILEVLRDARDERDPYGGAEQKADAFEELAGRIFLEPGRVLVDDVPEDERIEQREDLVDGGQHERERHEPRVIPQVSVEEFHVCARVRTAATVKGPRRSAGLRCPAARGLRASTGRA